MTTDERFRALTAARIDRMPQWNAVDADTRRAVRVVSTVLPFRTNRYVVDELIDWDRIPEDPIFQLTFPQRGMLSDDDFATMAALVDSGADRPQLEEAANRIRATLNPHPAGQMTDNVPEFGEEPVDGIQHKYRETVLFFPNRGQTCHAYCTFCFRWAQFVGDKENRFGTDDTETVSSYIAADPDVTDLLLTGGDPLIMKTRVLRRYVEPLLDIEHLSTIRIGTKAVAYWPQRFVSDDDADDLLLLFEEIIAAGKHVSVMGHYTHPVELRPEVSREAVRRITATGANIRMQSPILRHINDDADTWGDLWRTGVRLGCVPYYMFVVRDTGARQYFEVPLAETHRMFADAYRQVSGLARTVRGPSMSAHPGKVRVAGTTRSGDERWFVLEYLQARDPSWVGKPFFARHDPEATWFDELRPARPEDERFFQEPETSGHSGDRRVVTRVEIAPARTRRRAPANRQTDHGLRARPSGNR
jgi:KamA family protein